MCVNVYSEREGTHLPLKGDKGGPPQTQKRYRCQYFSSVQLPLEVVVASTSKGMGLTTSTLKEVWTSTISLHSI